VTVSALTGSDPRCCPRSTSARSGSTSRRSTCYGSRSGPLSRSWPASSARPSAPASGAFLAFPPILPASLTLLEQKEGTRRAGRNAIGAVLGSLGLVVFAMIGEAAFGQFNPVIVLLLATARWIITSLALYGMLAFLNQTPAIRLRTKGSRVINTLV
jgi:hypothetical protein